MNILFTATRVDLNGYRGADLGPITLTVKNPDGTAVDLNLIGATYSGSIYADPADASPLAEITVDATDGADGILKLSVPAATTANFARTTSSAGRLWWDFYLVIGNINTPLLAGRIWVHITPTFPAVE